MLLFLDFDGVLHGYGEPAFLHNPKLENLLLEFPEVEVVFSTSWRLLFSLDQLRLRFSEPLRHRFIGVLPDLSRPDPDEPHYSRDLRYYEIQAFFARKPELSGRPWRALEDEERHFPKDCPNVVWCEPSQGLGTPGVVKKLYEWLNHETASIEQS